MQENQKNTNWDDGQSYEERLNEAVRVATDLTNNCEEHFAEYPAWDQVKDLIIQNIEKYNLSEGDHKAIITGMAQGYAMIAENNKNLKKE